MYTIEGATTTTTAFLGTFADAPPYEAQQVASLPQFPYPAWIVSVPDADAGVARALAALDAVPSLNLVAMPSLAAFASDAYLAAVQQIAAYCATRGAFFILDPPASWASTDDVTSNIADVAPLVRENGALYWPALASGPASIAVAAVYVGTDTTRGVWTAPAGTTASLPAAPLVSLDDTQTMALSEAGVNAIRTIPLDGPVVWGARTLAGADDVSNELRYVQVRRTILYIEQSIKAGLSWTVFEADAPPLWAAITESVNAFLTSLWTSGALYGSKPDEAFFVRCDATTTSQDDIDAGIVNVVAGVALVGPAEFVILQIAVAAQSPSRSS